MRSLLILAVATGAFAAAPASAQIAPSQIVVHHSDLDLGTRGGIAVLDRRIRDAIENACGPTSAADLAGHNRLRACLKSSEIQVKAQRERVLAAASRNRSSRLAAVR